MNEPVLIELTHKKWIHNLHLLAYQGDVARYDLIQREYEKWCRKNQTQVREIDLFEMDVDSTPLPISTVTDKQREVSKPKKETNTKMEFGELLGNHMTGLSPYWNEIMINKNIHMPVLIFDPTWLLQDANYIRRKTKTTACQTDTSIYTGSPVMNEYRLTFAEWLVRFNLMIKYQELKYDILENQKDSPIAPRLIAHRDNCLQIQIDSWGKWPTAMRYDIAHRRNVWENRLSNGGMADVGTLDKRLLEQAERDAKHFGDYYYVDNPYAFGGPMQHVSPLDGNIYPENKSWDTAGALVDTHIDMISGRNLQVWNNHTTLHSSSLVERSNAGGTSRKPKGYHSQGQNFDPNYHKRQNVSSKHYNQSNHNNRYPTYPYQNNYYRNNQNPYQNNESTQNYNGGKGYYTHQGGDRPAIGPGSFNQPRAEGNPKHADPTAPVASGSK
ncbi:hypothetical protein DFH28DRAFT_883493 [Melampsora americana]|nr:hypothetical protein DFH28DRAFT_883493 [Melampsora americana]